MVAPTGWSTLGGNIAVLGLNFQIGAPSSSPPFDTLKNLLS
jgi:hypothetical protein